MVVRIALEEARMRALIAAGDGFAAASIRAMLAKENLICDATELGRDSLLLGRLYDYDIILLDLTGPDIEGYKLLRQLRAARVHTPILILSGRGELDEKVKFLRFGADDFLTKPFDRRELVARILAIVRRSQGHSESTIRTGKLAVNLDTRVVSVDDVPVHLTPKEYAVLELLSLRKGTVLTKGKFLNHLYGGMDEPQSKIIDILVCTLRKKLAQATGGSHYIETVRGCGYALRELATMPAATSVEGPKDLGARRSEVGRGAVTACRLEGARQLDPIEQQPSARDRPIGKPRASRIGSGAEPMRGSFPVEARFEDAVTTDGGPLRVPRPDPVGSLFACGSARYHEHSGAAAEASSGTAPTSQRTIP
jgi:two-component system, cell cycle response regulator CtrA